MKIRLFRSYRYTVSFWENHSILSLKAKVYDENGETLKSLGSDEIIDRSAISVFSLYTNQCVKLINPEVKTYPFTEEYKDEIKLYSRQREES